MRLAGKVSIVTGAASGLGRATALRFAQEGAKTIVADVLEDEGRGVAAEIVAAGGAASFQKLDVSKAQDWELAAAHVLADFGTIDVLVNNAGVSGTPYKDVFDLEGWERMMQINARGAFLGARAVTPIMVKNGGGAIINISSVCAEVAVLNLHFGYNASKAAISSLTRSLAAQFGANRIRCNSICPGVMPPMRSTASGANLTTNQSVLAAIPLGRIGLPEEVANAALFLASDEASFITGATVNVDGGFLAL